MCDCEELGYDEFVVALKEIEDVAPPPGAVMAEARPSEAATEPVPLVVAAKRRK